MKKLLILLFSLIILPLSINASDVYYCSDDAATGFETENKYKQIFFTERKFKIKIDFENASALSDSIYFGKHVKPSCFYNDAHKALYCINAIGSVFSINKTTLNYRRSSIINPLNPKDDLVIAYGTCEKF